MMPEVMGSIPGHYKYCVIRGICSVSGCIYLYIRVYKCIKYFSTFQIPISMTYNIVGETGLFGVPG